MPTAQAIIVAQAFRLMELGPVSSFADDTPQARDAAEQYPEALRHCLEACDWSFASTWANLSEVVSFPTGFTSDPALPHAFQLPGDAVRVIEVGDRWTRWRVDRTFLRADQAGPLPVRYTAVADDATLPATFKAAVAARLAAHLSPRWNGEAGAVSRSEQIAAARLSEAMRADARSASPARYDGGPDQPDWAWEAQG